MMFEKKHLFAGRRLRMAAARMAAGCLFLAIAVRADAQPRPAGAPVAVTTGEPMYTNPNWSPDGARLAFSAERYAGIFLLDLASGSIDTLTNAPAAGFGFSWSPDGRFILAREARFEAGRRTDAVTIFDAASGEAERLTDFRTDLSALPRWEADGAKAFLYANDKLEVFQVRNEEPGKTSTRAWIAAGEHGLARADLTGGTIEPFPAFEDQTILNLTPSPDGSRVAFEVLGGGMYTAHADGSRIVELGRGNRPAWSPDGDWIVYMKAEDDGHTFTESDLYVVRADGSETAQLTRTPDRLEMNPAWSPDGSRIAYDDFTDGNIYILAITR